MPEGRHLLGLILTVLAIATAGVGLWRWHQVEEAMRTGTRLPRHPTPAYLAVGLAVVGILVLVVAIVEMAGG